MTCFLPAKLRSQANNYSSAVVDSDAYVFLGKMVHSKAGKRKVAFRVRLSTTILCKTGWVDTEHEWMEENVIYQRRRWLKSIGTRSASGDKSHLFLLLEEP